MAKLKETFKIFRRTIRRIQPTFALHLMSSPSRRNNWDIKDIFLGRFHHIVMWMKTSIFSIDIQYLHACFVSFLSHLSLLSMAPFMCSEGLIPIWAADQLVILELRDINEFPMSPLLFSPGFHSNSRETEGSLLAVKSQGALMKTLQEVYTKTHTCSLTKKSLLQQLLCLYDDKTIEVFELPMHDM